MNTTTATPDTLPAQNLRLPVDMRSVLSSVGHPRYSEGVSTALLQLLIDAADGQLHATTVTRQPRGHAADRLIVGFGVSMTGSRPRIKYLSTGQYGQRITVLGDDVADLSCLLVDSITGRDAVRRYRELATAGIRVARAEGLWTDSRAPHAEVQLTRDGYRVVMWKQGEREWGDTRVVVDLDYPWVCGGCDGPTYEYRRDCRACRQG